MHRMFASLTRAGIAFLCLTAVAMATPLGSLPGANLSIAGWSGQKQFTDTKVDGQGTWTLDVQVEYAVFAPGNFNNSTTLLGIATQAALNAAVPLSSPSADNYVYAYQVFNLGSTYSGTSNSNFTLLTVDLIDYAIPPGTPNPTTLAVASGVAPVGVLTKFNGSYPQSNVLFGFLSSALTPDKFSNILIFSSPYGPVWAPSSAVGGQHTTSTDLLFELPTPLPEPTSAALAAIAIGCMLLTGHLRKRIR